jgi:hypothetical protein
MGVSGATEDTTITQLLNDAIAQIERETLRTFVAAADTREYPKRPPYVTLRGTMLTPGDDFVSVTTLTNGNGEVIAATDYYLLPIGKTPYYQIQLKQSATERFSVGSDGTLIELVGSFGFSAACPADIFRVILELVSLGFAGRAEGSGQEITSKGTLIDKAAWPDWMVESVNRYVRR